MKGSYDTFRLTNDDIRPGSSPQDLSAVLRAGNAVVSVPFKVGTKVYCIPMEQVTVTADVNGDPVVDLSANSDEKSLICAMAIHMQI